MIKLFHTYILLSLLLTSNLIAQNDNLIIDFNLSPSSKEFKNKDGIGLKTFQFGQAQFDAHSMLPYLNGAIDVPFGKAFSKLQIVNEEWVEIEFDISEEIKKSISGKIEVKFKEAEERKAKKIIYSILPYKVEFNKVFYLQSFSLDVLFNSKGLSKSFKKAPVFNSESVLKSGSGEWCKIAVLEDGVYKITYDFLIQNDINVNNVSTSFLHVFGNGTGILSENNSDFRYDDLIQNSIKIIDDGDGIFEAGEYILFYAKGPVKKVLEGGNVVHKTHHYSDTSFYFVNVGSSFAQKTIQNQSQSTNAITHTISTFDELKFVEQDLENVIESGRKWFGFKYDVTTQNQINFTFNNIDKSTSVIVNFKALGRSFTQSTSFTLSELNSGFSQTTAGIPSTTSSNYAKYGNETIESYTFKPTSDNLNFQVKFNKSSTPDAIGYIDYIEVLARRNLIMNSNQMEFMSLESVGAGNVSQFNLSNAQNVNEIWDVTDCRNVSKLQFNKTGATISFKTDTDTLRTFLALSNSTNFFQPIFSKKVKHQNLHKLGYADLIIVTPLEFLEQAEELKLVHESVSHSVHVVTDEEVYNEFSSGIPDVTAIKHFLKMFYDRATSPNEVPKHLLLFGDGSYDNKDRIKPNTNFLLTYQSEESFSPTATFTSDDYFVTLSDNESFSNSDMMDMGVGRMPIKNATEANAAVKKVTNYLSKGSSISENTGASCSNGETSSPLKDWRTYIALVADDEDFSGFIDDSENIYSRVHENNPEINIKKIYLDLYQQESTAGGQRYPQAKEDLRQRVQNGALILNFVGHGGAPGWTSERVLDVTTISEWTNYDKLPVFMTATCQFSRFDDPSRVSGGELTFLNPDGGGIALFTTTRVVFDSQNGKIIQYFYDSALHRIQEVPKDLGTIYLHTKNKYANLQGDSESRKFSLLGDPALRLALPQHDVELNKINDVLITEPVIDTLKALSRNTLKGFVKDRNGNKLSNFNGVSYITVFDKKKTVQNRQNDEKSTLRTFDIQNNILFKGKSTITNGEFEASFVVPKDIDYQYGRGKISFYSENSSEDAIGYSDSLVVGGFDANAPEDNTGPQIKLFMNDSTFVYGGLTDESPRMIAEIFDENGINTVGNGIGHDITVIIDNDQSNPIVLNDYYESDIDTYQSGKINYLMNDLSPGTHTLTLKVWDVYNNSSSKTLEFTVVEKEKMAIDHVLNYPNPFTTHTQFMFEHNQACSFFRVKIEIFTITGKLVNTIKQTVKTEGFRVDPISWNGRDAFGDKIGRGVYIYKVSVESPSGEKADKFEKLVILN